MDNSGISASIRSAELSDSLCSHRRLLFGNSLPEFTILRIPVTTPRTLNTLLFCFSMLPKYFLLEDRFSRIHHQISSQQQLPLYQLSGFLMLPSSDPHWHDVVCWHLSGCICYYLTYINAVLPLDGILLQFVSWRFWSLCFPVSLALRVERIFFTKLQLKINLILNTSTLAHHLTKSTLSKVPLTLTFQQCYRSYNS